MNTFAVKAIILQNDQILILKRNSLESCTDCWDLPGGLIEKDETEIEALIREVYEETNLNLIKENLSKSLKWSFFRSLDQKRVEVQNYTYYSVINSQVVNLSSEHTSYKWISPSEILNYKLKDKSLYTCILNAFIYSNI